MASLHLYFLSGRWNSQLQMVSGKCSSGKGGKVRELLITFIVGGKITDTSVIANLRF